MLAFLVFGTGAARADLSLGFFAWVTTAGVAQIVATSLMIHAFSLRNYAVGTVYSKTETVFVALFSTFIAHEALKLGAWIGILVRLGGVAILSVRGNFANVRSVLADLTHKGVRGHAHDALDLGAAVDTQMSTRLQRITVLRAEVDPAGELAHEHEVDPGHHLGLERRGRGERRVHAHRAQVRKGAERGAQPQEPLFGAHRGVRVRPPRGRRWPRAAPRPRCGRH